MALKPYKMQLVQELKMTDYSHRRRLISPETIRRIFNPTRRKLIFICQDISTSKIATFGLLKIHNWLLRSLCMLNVSLYGARCGLEASLGSNNKFIANQISPIAWFYGIQWPAHSYYLAGYFLRDYFLWDIFKTDSIRN